MRKTTNLKNVRPGITGFKPRPLPSQRSTYSEIPRIFAILLAHVPLAMLMNAYPIISTLHALVTFIFGLLWLADSKPARLIYLTAYISGVEILWRATEAGVFYEFGKYSISLLLILAIFKYGLIGKASKAPMLVFLLLLPSLLVLPYFDRQDIAFNLNGPLVLAVSSMFFSAVKIDIGQLKKILIAMVAPIFGMTFLATFFTLSVESLDFTGVSIKATSAFTGPNQVATILGLGAVCAFYYALLEKQDTPVRFVMIGLSLWMIAQAMLTFSRGGLWAAIGALLVGIYFLWRQDRSKAPLLLIITFPLVVVLVVLPQLDRFTGGLLRGRLVDTESTGRIEIIQSDMAVFQDNPAFGVGPGQSYYYHDIFFRQSQAHTEYSRMLAEHGLLGIGAMLILFYITTRRFLGKSSRAQKSFSGMFTSWALLTMLHSALRLAAPGFAFGLAAAQLDSGEKSREVEVGVQKLPRHTIFPPIRDRSKHGT